jgi:hypothetical protein
MKTEKTFEELINEVDELTKKVDDLNKRTNAFLKNVNDVLLRYGDGYCEVHNKHYKLLNSPMGGCPDCRKEREDVNEK